MIQMFKGLSAWYDRTSDRPLLPQPWLAKALGSVGLLVLLALIVAISAIASRVIVGHRPPPAVYFSRAGDLQRIPVLTDPSLSDIKLKRWATRSAREIFSFNFANYDDHMSAVSVLFTDLGWKAFEQGLVNSGLEDRVKTKQLDVFLVPESTARLIAVLQAKNVYVFRTQMPALVVYKSASNTQVTRVMVQMMIRQVPTSENPDGIGISDIAVAPSQE